MICQRAYLRPVHSIWTGAGAATLGGFGIVELHLIKFCISAVAGHQCIVGTGLDNFAVGHDNDLIGIADSGEAVGYHQRGATLAQLVQRRLNCVFRLCIQRRGGFVKQQDRRVPKQRTRDGHPLSLAP